MMKFTNASEALPALANYVLDGEEMGSRVGRVYERRHVTFEITKPWQREITLLGRGANIAAQIAETMWVLAGRNDIGWLSHYLPRAAEFSDDGQVWRAGYGPRLRAWHGHDEDPNYVFDQLEFVVKDLQAHPQSRRAVISLWDPAQDHVDSKDIPCNNWLHFMSRNGKLEMHVVIRSNDLWWGWSGINQFEWSALQEIIAGLLGIGVGSAYYTVGSLHLYARHWLKARKLQPYSSAFDGLEDSPRWEGSVYGTNLDKLIEHWFEVEKQIRHASGDLERAEVHRIVTRFGNPMLGSWLRVLEWYWWGDGGLLSNLARSRLSQAAMFTPTSVLPKRTRELEEPLTEEGLKVATANEAGAKQPFIDYACELHASKDKAYGDSWIKRGPLLGAVANIDRKVDRLGKTDEQETALDTATDLLLYLAKFLVWLRTGDATGTQHQALVRTELEDVGKLAGYSDEQLMTILRRNVDSLDAQVQRGEIPRATVRDTLPYAYTLASMLYWRKGNEKRAWNPEA